MLEMDNLWRHKSVFKLVIFHIYPILLPSFHIKQKLLFQMEIFVQNLNICCIFGRRLCKDILNILPTLYLTIVSLVDWILLAEFLVSQEIIKSHDSVLQIYL